jgi:hypothetical protein
MSHVADHEQPRMIEKVSPFRADKHPHTCKCGHDRNHPMVSPVAEYTRLGWALILIGISAEPIAIRYKCRRCETTLERTTDKKTIAETQLWG